MNHDNHDNPAAGIGICRIILLSLVAWAVGSLIVFF